jgi:hypothetical protein
MFVHFSDDDSDNGRKHLNWIAVHCCLICEYEGK